MERECYNTLHEVGEIHWWVRVRDAIVLAAVARAGAKRGVPALDLGCGVGILGEKLRAQGYSVSLLDTSEEALARCRARGFAAVHAGDAIALPFGDASFDYLTATDVLEHIEHDSRALGEMYRVLRPGGAAVLTVPAHQFLYGPHDRKLHHFRRYSKHLLVRRARDAGFGVERVTYFNTLLFVPIAIFRLLSRLFPVWAGGGEDLEVNSRFLNALFYRIFSIDRLLLSYTNLPVGVSLLAVLRKR